MCAAVHAHACFPTCSEVAAHPEEGWCALRQSSENVNSYFVFFSSQKDAAAAGQCVVFNEARPQRPLWPCCRVTFLRLWLCTCERGASAEHARLVLAARLLSARGRKAPDATVLFHQGAEHAFRVMPAPGPDEVRWPHAYMSHPGFGCVVC